MPGLSRSFKQLEKELLALSEETMLIEQLDGFVAGLLVCPDLIMPGEWLPVVWNPDGGDQEPAFDDIDHANRVLGLVREYYNDIARTLMERPDRYGPLFPMDKRNGDIIWELWIEGFERAVALRPAAWESLLNADPDTQAAICGMLGLVAVANGDEDLSEKESDALSEAAPDSIGHWIVTLHEWRLANYRPPQGTGLGPNPFSAPTKKAGRNDSCPCGSGKKYKKCCGLN